jgi:hypothetical protein
VEEEPSTPTKSPDDTEKADPSSEKTVPSSEGVRSPSPAPSRISKRQRMQSPAPPTSRKTRSASRSPAPERPPSERKTPRKSSRAAAAPPTPSFETSPGKSIEVTQSVTTDPTTGAPTETTTVRLDLSPTRAAAATAEAETGDTAPGLVASEAEVTASLEQGRELVEKLKQEGVLREAAGVPTGSKRPRTDEEEEAEAAKTPFWRRPWMRRRPRNAIATATGEASTQAIVPPVTPKGRRLAALAGVVVVGAATCVSFLILASSYYVKRWLLTLYCSGLPLLTFSANVLQSSPS